MATAILAFVLSAVIGTCVYFTAYGIGIVLSISIIGAFIIYQLEKINSSIKNNQ